MTYFSITHFLSILNPIIRITFGWYPGGKGFLVKKTVIKLATPASKAKLPQTQIGNPNLVAFWVEIHTGNQTLMPSASKKPLHNDLWDDHLKAMSKFKNQSMDFITQMRSGHIPFFSFLHCISARPDPQCECRLGIETSGHYFLWYSIHSAQREDLRKPLHLANLEINKTTPNNPKAYTAITIFFESTGKFSNR